MPAKNHYLISANATDLEVRLTHLYAVYGAKKTDNDNAFEEIIEAIRAFDAKLQDVRGSLVTEQVEAQKMLLRDFLSQYACLQKESPDITHRSFFVTAAHQQLTTRINKESNYLKSAITLSTKLLGQMVDPAAVHFDDSDFLRFNEIKQGIRELTEEKVQNEAIKNSRISLWGKILIGVGATLLMLVFVALALASGPLLPTVCYASLWLSCTFGMSFSTALNAVGLSLGVPFIGSLVMMGVGCEKAFTADEAQEKLDKIEPKLNFYRNIDKKAPNITLFNANAAVQAQPLLVLQGSEVQPLAPVYLDTHTVTNTATKR